MHDIENAQHEKGRQCTYWKMTENHNQKMKEWKMYDMEKGRKCTPRKMTEKSCLGNDFSIIFRGVHFLSFSMLCIFHSFIFQVYFFCHFPGVIFLPFSGCAFSILSFSGCDFSVIFRGVHFLPFSMSYIFHSFIFWL